MATSKKAIANKIKNDPGYERTRENMAEFARAGKAAKLLRLAFRELLVNTTDRKLIGQLMKTFTRIVFTDAVNGRGDRTVSNGDLQQLQGFNFNQRSSLTEILFAHPSVSIDRATGQVTVIIPPFVPRTMIQGIRLTTHFRIVVAAAAINFDNDTHEHALQATGELPWDNALTNPINLSMVVPAVGTQPIIAVLGIELYTRVEAGGMYRYKGDGLNAAAIVKVSLND